MQLFGLPQTDATALALQGFEDALRIMYVNGQIDSCDPDCNNFAVEKYGMSLTDADIIYDQYINGPKGTRCF